MDLVREKSGKCQGISLSIICGNPEFETDSNRNHVFRNNANKLSDRNLDKRLSPTCSIDDCSSQKLDSFQIDLSKGLYPRENVLQIKAFKTLAERSSNLVHYFQQMTFGNRCRLKLQKVGP